MMTQQSKHTPGPWLIGEDQCVDDCWSIVTTSCGAIIANVNDKAARHANARLIAAAPDLLAALTSFVDALDSPKTLRIDLLLARLEFARAAIAKARGQS